jgi:hypothetical protein
MKKLLFTILPVSIIWLAGCGSQTMPIVGGAAGGMAFQKTLEGMQADLERREQALITRYNELVDAGAKAETLEDLKKEISDTVRLRQTTQVAADVSKTSWDDPKAAGGAIAAIIATGYAWLKRKELNNTVAGIRSFRAKSDETTKHQLDQVLTDKKAAT